MDALPTPGTTRAEMQHSRTDTNPADHPPEIENGYQTKFSDYVEKGYTKEEALRILEMRSRDLCGNN